MDSSMLIRLNLVYPPITNREGDDLSEDESVRAYVQRSQFYIIGQRPDLVFRNLKFDEDNAEFEFDLLCGDTVAEGLRLPLAHIAKLLPDDTRLCVRLGDRRFDIVDADTERTIYFWATPNALLYNVWRGRYEVIGLADVTPFTTFDVLYVGISREANSLARLFDQGHKKRAKILSQEMHMTPNASLSDEVCILLFDHEVLRFDTLTGDDGEDAEHDVNKVVDIIMAGEEAFLRERVVADVEKAFAKLMDPQYNEIVYAGFPQSKDGLWGQGLHRYGYVIDETLTLRTAAVSVRGVYNGWLAGHDKPEQAGDLLAVKDEHVELIKFDRIVP